MLLPWVSHCLSSPIGLNCPLAGLTQCRNGEEKPRAYVAIQDASRGRVTPEEIQRWMETRVAKHKRLTGGVVFVDEVPKLASGKIQRKVMREWAKRDAEALGSERVERARL
jgi:4-coumarate--CoA ligase